MPSSKEMEMITPSSASELCRKILEMTRKEIDEAFSIDARLMGNEKGKDVKTKSIVEWG